MFYFRVLLAFIMLTLSITIVEHFVVTSALTDVVRQVDRAKDILSKPEAQIKETLEREIDRGWFCFMVCRMSGAAQKGKVITNTGNINLKGVTLGLPASKGFRCIIGGIHSGLCIVGNEKNTQVFVRIEISSVIVFSVVFSSIAILVLLGICRLLSPFQKIVWHFSLTSSQYTKWIPILLYIVVIIFAVIWLLWGGNAWEPIIVIINTIIVLYQLSISKP